MTESTDSANENLDESQNSTSSKSGESFKSSAQNMPQIEMPPPLLKKTIWDLAKTYLDYEACKTVLADLVTKTETKLRDQPNAALELKPLIPIENFKPASPCSSSWENMSGTNQVRYCKQCLLRVYDFKSTDKADAEQLIFQQEGLNDVLLYKRKDGRFLTSDCPVAVRARITLIVALVAVVVILVGVLYVLSQIPAPKEPTVAKTPVVSPVKPHKAASTAPAASKGAQAGFSFPAPRAPDSFTPPDQENQADSIPVVSPPSQPVSNQQPGQPESNLSFSKLLRNVHRH